MARDDGHIPDIDVADLAAGMPRNEADGDLSQARLAACDAMRIVLGTCLGMLGIAAPGRI